MQSKHAFLVSVAVVGLLALAAPASAIDVGPSTQAELTEDAPLLDEVFDSPDYVDPGEGGGDDDDGHRGGEGCVAPCLD